MLEKVIDSRGIVRVNSLSQVDRHTRLVVIPGGVAYSIYNHLDITKKKFSEYLLNGGKYLGICAGAILATEYIYPKPSLVMSEGNPLLSQLHKIGQLYQAIMDQKKINVPTCVYPGECMAPHVVVNIDASHPENMCAVDVMNTFSKTSFKTLHYSGPVFLTPPVEATVLLSYCNPLGVEEVKFSHSELKFNVTGKQIQIAKPAAALSYPLGEGKMVLTGVHPEMNPATFESCAVKYKFPGKFPQELAASESSRVEFIDDIFRELGLGTEIICRYPK